MYGSSSRTWTFPAPGSREAPGEAITEPSGSGPFAEAMRELIAQLNPVPETLREAQAERLTSQPPPLQAEPRAAARGHLRLVR